MMSVILSTGTSRANCGDHPSLRLLRIPEGACVCYNPCPCGYYGDPVKECTCSSAMVTRYQKRISGPLLDRIDIHVEVPRVEYEKLSDDRLG
jgi:hypothetical protein